MSAPAEVTDIGSGYAVEWLDHGVKLMVEYLQKQAQGIIGEISIVSGNVVLCESLRINLNTEAKTKAIAKKLEESDRRINLSQWGKLIESTCVLILRRFREGEPLQSLTPQSTVEPLSFQVNPIVFKGKPTVLFGDGGLGKSSFALMTAMLVSTGGSVAGLSAIKGRPLYLDYEDSQDVHIRRMQALAAEHPELKRADVLYLSLNEPLYNVTHTLLRRIQTEHVSFIVLDSLAAATGGDASAEAATKVFRTIRSLNCGALVIAHIPKMPTEGQDPSIYGSVFHKNFARSTWELRKEQEVDSDVSLLGLFNRKSNLSRLHAPLGLQVTQNADSTSMRYEAFDLNQAPEIEKALPLPNRIRNLLESDGSLYTSKDIAEQLGAPLPTVKAVLSKHNRIKWHMIGEGRDAKWTALNR